MGAFKKETKSQFLWCAHACTHTYTRTRAHTHTQKRKPKNFQRSERLMIYFKNSAPSQPTCWSTPSWFLMLLIRRANVAACEAHFKYILSPSEKQEVSQHLTSPFWLTWASFVQPDSSSSKMALAHLLTVNNFVSSRIWHVLDYSHSGKVPGLLPAQEVWIFVFQCLFAKYNLLPCQFILISAHYKGLSTSWVLEPLELLMQNTVQNETPHKTNKEVFYTQGFRIHFTKVDKSI